jgi:outer membrane protein FlgP
MKKMLIASLLITPLLFAGQGKIYEDVNEAGGQMPMPPMNQTASYQASYEDTYAQPDEYVIQNAPTLRPSNIITIRAIGMGVAPDRITSKAQRLVLAKRAALVDGYRQLGEKMYGIKINAKDVIKDAVVKSSIVRTQLYAVVRNAEVVETMYNDNGLMQVEMEVKLDGRRWHNILSGI